MNRCNSTLSSRQRRDRPAPSRTGAEKDAADQKDCRAAEVSEIDVSDKMARELRHRPKRAGCELPLLRRFGCARFCVRGRSKKGKGVNP
jgi:hypothetical protein